MTHYHVDHNLSGYLPMSDEHAIFSDWQDALNYLRDELMQLDHYGTDDESPEFLSAQLEDAEQNFNRATYGDDVSVPILFTDDVYALPEIYWLVACNDDCGVSE